jgi:alpha-beta hydrolase superfamily lysophospholipase
MILKFELAGKQHHYIKGMKWLPQKGEPKAIIMIVHGMAEHSERYAAFAHLLTLEGFAVYAYDHRGHGKSVKDEKDLGFIANSNGWELLLDDMKAVNNLIRRDYPNKPIILFGHSMGSTLSRQYVLQFGHSINGIILSGTGSNPGLLGRIGLLIASVEKIIKGSKAKSPLLTKLTFGKFNKPFSPSRTKYDWLSRNEEIVDKYIKDPRCGFVCTTSFFQQLIKGIVNLHKLEYRMDVEKIPPTLLISGEKDPLGNNGTSILEVCNSYKKAGINDISYKVFVGGRHELINETNNDEVISFIKNWIINRF